ncbi:hypothetical protein B0H10DRAFT_1730055, partial [Mycena sp. CBHHK59/15]
LISVGKLDETGYTTTFGGGRVSVLNVEGKGFTCKKGVNRLYQLGGDAVKVRAQRTGTTALAASITLENLHRCLAHSDPQTIIEMYSKNLVDGLVIGDRTLHGRCVNCIHGRQKAHHHNKPIAPEGTEAGDLVCIDLWGPARTASRGER